MFEWKVIFEFVSACIDEHDIETSRKHFSSVFYLLIFLLSADWCKLAPK